MSVGTVIGAVYTLRVFAFNLTKTEQAHVIVRRHLQSDDVELYIRNAVATSSRCVRRRSCKCWVNEPGPNSVDSAVRAVSTIIVKGKPPDLLSEVAHRSVYAGFAEGLSGMRLRGESIVAWRFIPKSSGELIGTRRREKIARSIPRRREWPSHAREGSFPPDCR